MFRVHAAAPRLLINKSFTRWLAKKYGVLAFRHRTAKRFRVTNNVLHRNTLAAKLNSKSVVLRALSIESAY